MYINVVTIRYITVIYSLGDVLSILTLNWTSVFCENTVKGSSMQTQTVENIRNKGGSKVLQ